VMSLPVGVKAPTQLFVLRVQSTYPQSDSSEKAEKMSVMRVTWVVVEEL